MSKKKPIELMHYFYGERRGLHICAECCNFVSMYCGGKKLFKCRAYGSTCSSASDWAKKWLACGMFGNPVDHAIITSKQKNAFAKIGNKRNTQTPIDGQLKMG